MDGVYSGAQSPWSQPPAGPYMAPLNVHYHPMARPSPYPPGRPHLLSAPPPQLFPGNSYVLDDPYNTPMQAPDPAMATNGRPFVSKAVMVTAVLSLIAQGVLCGVIVLEKHVELAITVYWIFAFGGGLSCLLSLGGILVGGSFNFAARLGLLLGGCGSAATGVYWFCLHKEGAGVLFLGQAIFAIWMLLCGDTVFSKQSRRNNFSFAQPLLKDEDLEVGR